MISVADVYAWREQGNICLSSRTIKDAVILPQRAECNTLYILNNGGET
jgi:hypothetical protein